MMLWLVLACGGAEQAAVEASPVASESIADQSCAVCGMIVREQPSPRAQLRHRDGTHLHFCSLGDLRAHVQQPSPHGAVVATWVEALPSDFDPSARATRALAVVPAESAFYVVGFERGGIMGRPALSFADTTAAATAAANLSARVVPWDAVLSTPFYQDPKEE